jgi:hypothetical protein
MTDDEYFDRSHARIHPARDLAGTQIGDSLNAGGSRAALPPVFDRDGACGQGREQQSDRDQQGSDPERTGLRGPVGLRRIAHGLSGSSAEHRTTADARGAG